ncbi:MULTISPECIES: YraN family protein [unclassified Chelatococcus]|uniref:YraN family protein n=1 Tax=unclassified Chelatococcus TaxID=2638111 RepID=UPI001BCB43B6|nr:MULTISPECIES: YraN family protein [unclassified Chelatococcus]MBS7696375.1 YraN family protein [Chelatococcus sp. YT9]MBX3556985.1 YraN family protein [Chelatococcus sp.]
MTAVPPRQRLVSHRRGLGGERLAALLLMIKGYRIIARRYAALGGEIDLVAKRGRTIVFVEVKARRELDDARVAITSDKRRRLGRAARHWLSHNPWAAGMTLRFDAVFVAPRRLPRHLVAVASLAMD